MSSSSSRTLSTARKFDFLSSGIEMRPDQDRLTQKKIRAITCKNSNVHIFDKYIFMGNCWKLLEKVGEIFRHCAKNIFVSPEKLEKQDVWEKEIIDPSLPLSSPFFPVSFLDRMPKVFLSFSFISHRKRSFESSLSFLFPFLMGNSRTLNSTLVKYGWGGEGKGWGVLWAGNELRSI